MTKIIDINDKLSTQRERDMLRMAGAVDELVSDFGDLLSIEEIAVVLANRLGAVIRVEEQVKLTELLDICQDILNTYAMRP